MNYCLTLATYLVLKRNHVEVFILLRKKKKPQKVFTV